MKKLYRHHDKFRLRLVFGLVFLVLISACKTLKNTDSNDGTKSSKDKASKKNKKEPKVMCYCPSF